MRPYQAAVASPPAGESVAKKTKSNNWGKMRALLGNKRLKQSKTRL